MRLRLWLVVAIVLIVILLLGNGGLIALTTAIYKDTYVKGDTTLSNAKGQVVGTRAATHNLPLLVAPVLPDNELFSAETIHFKVPTINLGPNGTSGLSDVASSRRISVRVSRVEKVNSTAVVFYGIGGEEIRVWNGVTTARLSATGAETTICSADVTCAAFQVEGAGLTEKYLAEAEAALGPFAESRRRLLMACEGSHAPIEKQMGHFWQRRADQKPCELGTCDDDRCCISLLTLNKCGAFRSDCGDPRACYDNGCGGKADPPADLRTCVRDTRAMGCQYCEDYYSSQGHCVTKKNGGESCKSRNECLSNSCSGNAWKEKTCGDADLLDRVDPSRWMEEMGDAIGDLTLLDLTLPATHDTLTFDLGPHLPENTDIGPGDANGFEWLLEMDKVRKIGDANILSFMTFLQEQAQAQIETLTRQLDLGIRFFDWRIVNNNDNFYGVHLLRTEKTAETWTTALLKWLDDHPKEIVVMWCERRKLSPPSCHNKAQRGADAQIARPSSVHLESDFCCPVPCFRWSSHGNGQLGCDPEQKEEKSPGHHSVPRPQWRGEPAAVKRHWDAFVEKAGDKIVDVTETALNETTLNTLWKKKYQILVYAAGYCELTNEPGKRLTPWEAGENSAGTKFALPDYGKCGGGCGDTTISADDTGCVNTIADCGSTDHVFVGKPEVLAGKEKDMNGADRRAAFKKKNVFYLSQMVTSANIHVIADKLIAMFPDAPRLAESLPNGWVINCGTWFGHPPPMSGFECPKTLMDQVRLSNYFLQAPLAKAFNNGWTPPNAFYIDGIEEDGGYGAMNIGSKDGAKQYFPYVKMILGFNIVGACGNDTSVWSDACKKLAENLGNDMIPGNAQQMTPIFWDDRPGRTILKLSSWANERLLDASKCPNKRDDLCGALGSGDKIQNGERVENAEGKILCFTDAGDVQSGQSGSFPQQSLGLSGGDATLRMQDDGNLVYYDAKGQAKWAFNNAYDAPAFGCTDSTSCFLDFILPSACTYGAGKSCTGVKTKN